MGHLDPTSLKQSYWAKPSLDHPNYRPVALTINACCCKPPSSGVVVVVVVLVCIYVAKLTNAVFKLDLKS